MRERLAGWRARGDALMGILTGNARASAPVKLRAAGIEPAWFPIGAYGDEAAERAALARLALQRAEAWAGRGFAPGRVFVGWRYAGRYRLRQGDWRAGDCRQYRLLPGARSWSPPRRISSPIPFTTWRICWIERRAD